MHLMRKKEKKNLLSKIITVLIIFLLAGVLTISVICANAIEAQFSDSEVAVSKDLSLSSSDSNPVDVSAFGEDEYIACNSPIMTVDVLLKKMNLSYSNETGFNYVKDYGPFDNMMPKVSTYSSETYTEIAVIPCGVEYIDVQTMPKGSCELVLEGVNGKEIITHKITRVDGAVFSDEVIATETLEAVKNTVYYRGVGGSVVSEDGTVFHYSYYIDSIATAYKTGGITATGKEATDGIIAVDPRVIPYGTKVFITGNYKEIGVCSAEDTGGAIKGTRIDICMSGTHQDLLNFGRRCMRVYILE